LKAGNLKRLHELADENVVQVVGNAPQEKQKGHQDERRQLSSGKQCVPSSR